MPKKALASLNVVINAVTKPLFRGLNRASKRVTAFGTQMKTVGRSISTSFTMPFAMIGVAGAKMAIDFEQSMTKINTLVGTSAEEVNKLGESVKSMSVETATPAKDLADALFFIQSAGIKGAESLKVLEVSAKGASMNMGEITDIASATTSIMEAFGKTSNEAGDLLHETLKQGKFEASEFMNKIGQVIPTASGLGISFEELGGAVATMSKLSGDASGSLTAINSVMMKLATPGQEQKQILADLGMSYDDLNGMLKDSLMGTLNHLFTELEGNDEALVRVFGSSKAVKGAFATAGLQAETYAKVLDGMNNSMGNVEKGFQTQSKTVGFTMKQSLEKLKLAGMELGAVLMPVFTQIAEGAVKIATAFTNLDSGTKKLIVGAGALLAFSGPLMTLIGTIITGLGAMLSPLGLAVVAFSALFKVVYDNWGAVKKALTSFVNYFIDLYNESMIFRAGIQIIGLAFKNLWANVKFVFNAMKGIVSNTIKTWIAQFGAVAKVIASALKLDTTGVKEGAKDYMKATADGIKNNIEVVKTEAKILGEEIAKNTADAIANTMSREKIEFVEEDDIQTGVDNIENWLTDKLGKVKNKLKGFMGGSTLLVPEGPSGSPEGPSGSPSDDGSAEEEAIEKKKSLLEAYWSWAQDGYEGFADKVSEVWGQISQVAGAVMQGIGNLWQAEFDRKMTILDNEQIAEEEAMNTSREREIAKIENSKMNEESKEKALTKIKDKYESQQFDIDEKFGDKRKELERKQAKRDKKMKVAQAIMSTAQAVVQALTAGPIVGPILATMIAGLGMAQIAQISATPLPMAQGGIAFGPVNALVGEYPGASSDPEVVAPLSKLKSMLGSEMNVSLQVGGVLKGNDIFLANATTDEQRNRYI